MPIFEYVCASCGHGFEELVRSSDATVACPKCHAKKTERKLSVFAARQGTASSSGAAPTGMGCGRCGDPNGPCAM